MKTFIVYAERTVLESVEIQAKSEAEALTTAFLDSEDWQTEQDMNWVITNAKEVSHEPVTHL